MSSVLLTRDGWLFKVNDKCFKVMDDLFSTDFDVKFAEILGVEVKNAWIIKNQLIENYWPASLDEWRNLFPGVVGEDGTVKLLILTLATLKLRNPEERLMGVIVEASNSAGKSHIIKEILKPLRPLNIVFEFTRMTGAFLERKFQNENVDRKILYLQESNNAPAQLHLILSEGKLHIGLVERNDGGLKPTEIVVEGQPFLVITTSNWTGSQDLVHRCIVVNLDESREQTLRILAHQVKLNSDPVFSELFTLFCNGCMKIFKILWQKIPENIDVVVPFLPLLEQKIQSLPNINIKLRRDFRKLISLIKASAILFYKNRIMAVREKNYAKNTIIIATLEDLRNVLELIDSGMRQVLTSLGEKELQVLKTMAEAKQEFYNYSELARLTGLPSSTLRLVIIPRLENKGYVLVDRESRPHRIELVREDFENPKLYIEEEQAEKFIKDCIQELSLIGYSFTLPEKTSENGLNHEKKPQERVVVETTQDLGFSDKNKLKESFSEKNLEKSSDSKNKPVERVVCTTTHDLSFFFENNPQNGEIS